MTIDLTGYVEIPEFYILAFAFMALVFVTLYGIKLALDIRLHVINRRISRAIGEKVADTADATQDWAKTAEGLDEDVRSGDAARRRRSREADDMVERHEAEVAKMRDAKKRRPF